MALPDSYARNVSVSETFVEGLRYFMGEGKLNNALSQLAHDLDEHKIDYLIIGAVALLAYGYPRFTEDIALIMTADGLEKFHNELVGLGYQPAFEGAKKRLRSTVYGVPIEIMRTGEYPGDGKPKPVQIPDPAISESEIDGIKFVTLEKLIELKLASGISASDRLKDLADVQELIRIRKLDAEFATKLNPYVREKFLELHQAIITSNSVQERE